MAYIGQAPTNVPLTSADIQDGTIGLADLSATGTKDATTFLRGDNTFAELSTKIKKVDFQSNNTRTALSVSTSKTTILSGTYTNVVASSKVLIHAKMPIHNPQAGATTVGFTWNGTDYDAGFTYVYEDTANVSFATMIKSFDCPASTGSINWVIYSEQQNSSSTKIANVVNPNTTEDARMAQQETQLSFMEYIT